MQIFQINLWSAGLALVLTQSCPALVSIPSACASRVPPSARASRAPPMPASPERQTETASNIAKENGPGAGTALEAICRVSLFLGASRAPTLLAYWMLYGAETRLLEGGVLSGIHHSHLRHHSHQLRHTPDPCHQLTNHPYLQLSIKTPVKNMLLPVTHCPVYRSLH